MSGFPMRRVKDVFLRILPDEEVESANDIPSGRVTRQFTLNLVSKKKLLLGLSSTVKTKLLRHEQNLLASEAVLVALLKDDPITQESDPETASSRALSPFSPPDTFSRHLSPISTPSSSSGLASPAPPVVTKPLPSRKSHASALELTPLPPLSSFLPIIIHHEPTNTDLGYHYTIYEPPCGTPLSITKCTEKERYAINVQLGQLAYNMATITSPNGTFGPVLKVLGASNPSKPVSPLSSPLLAKAPESVRSPSFSNRQRSQTTSPLPPTSGVGSQTWDVAFNVLFESILRDGEDMALNLPFPAIRAHINRLTYVLKTITVPRLFLFDAGDEDNILVSRSSADPGESSLQFSGFRDWTGGIFGDPLLSSFWEDWDGNGPRRKGWGEGCEFIDKKTLPVRLMLYRCYRACVDIVREYYRPRKESSEREMVARKRLIIVLGELDRVVIGREGEFASAAETPTGVATNPTSPSAESEATEPATPKRTQDEALPGQKLPRWKKPKLDPETSEPAEADDEKEDDDQENSSDEEEERHQPPTDAARPNPVSLDYILNG